MLKAVNALGAPKLLLILLPSTVQPNGDNLLFLIITHTHPPTTHPPPGKVYASYLPPWGLLGNGRTN